MKTISTVLFIVTWSLVFIFYQTFQSVAQDAQLDAPHDVSSGLGCLTCHDITAFDQPNLIPDIGWEAADVDDTQYNNICWGCHDGIDAPLASVHSSLATSDRYGDWSVGCSVCHNQHSQEQDKKYGSAYGKFIRETIDLSKIVGKSQPGVYKKVKFTGVDEFARSDSSFEGICEVCHTSTGHWSTTAVSGGDEHFSSVQCTICHPHDQGLRAVPPNHAPLVTVPSFCQGCHSDSLFNLHNASRSGWINCEKCHDKSDSYALAGFLPLYLDNLLTYDDAKNKGMLVSGQVRCDECHRGQYREHVTDTGHGKIHDKVLPDKEKCLSCHYSDVVTEHNARRDFTCLHCHNRPDLTLSEIPAVTQAIADGVSGITIYCSDCHNDSHFMTAGNTSYIDEHHVTPYAVGGDCTHCHVIGRGVDGPVGGPCGDCHGDSRYAYRHTNAAMLNLDNVNDYRACFSCHLEGSQGYVADPENDPPGHPAYTGTPVVKPMHALPVGQRYPGDLWNSDQCGYATCSDGIPNLPPCTATAESRYQCDNFIEMAADPRGYIYSDPEGYLASLSSEAERTAAKEAIISLSKKTPGFGLYDYYFTLNFGAAGDHPYIKYIPANVIDNTLMDGEPDIDGTTTIWWKDNWQRLYMTDSYRHLEAGSTVSVSIAHDDGSGMQQYEVYSLDGSGGGGMSTGSGDLAVNISPSEAIDDGARWRYDGLDWQDSGYVAAGVRSREHVVEFQKIPGWVTPSPIQVPVADGSAATVSGSVATYVACSDTPELTIFGPNSISWDDPMQVVTYSVTGWHGTDVEWKLSTGGADGFRIVPISSVTARLEKIGSSTAGSYSFTVGAKGSDCYGNSSTVSVPVTISGNGALSPESVNQDGMIGSTDIDELRLGGANPSDLVHVGGAFYARASSSGILSTFTISDTGGISDSSIDAMDLGFTDSDSYYFTWRKYRAEILNVTGDVFVVAVGRELKTVTIDSSNGNITPLNTLTIHNDIVVTEMYKATEDIYIIIYVSGGQDYYMSSVQISDAGQMVQIDGPWAFDTSVNHTHTDGALFDLVPVGTDIYALAQVGTSGTDTTPFEGYLRTFSVQNGTLPASFIDTYKFAEVRMGNLDLFNTDDKGNYGITYLDSRNKTALKTIHIADDGTIGSIKHSLVLEQMHSIAGSFVTRISDDVFAFAGGKAYVGDLEWMGSIMVETYRITDGYISPTAVDYSDLGSAVEDWGTFLDFIHVSGDIYAIDNGRGKIKTISINSDGDADGVASLIDNCPNEINVGQVDSDRDGVGDSCDTCIKDASNDIDGDGICGDVDPCPVDPDNECDS